MEWSITVRLHFILIKAFVNPDTKFETKIKPTLYDRYLIRSVICFFLSFHRNENFELKLEKNIKTLCNAKRENLGEKH